MICTQIWYGDYVSIFDGRDLQSEHLITFDENSNNKKRTISSLGRYMLVQFLTDEVWVKHGFDAIIRYIPIKPDCANWLNMPDQFLNSPDYPTINCSWVIANSIDSSIVLNFETIEVNNKHTFYLGFT